MLSRRAWSRCSIFVTVACVIALWAEPLFAHEVHGEVVLLDIGESAVRAEVQIPLGPLALARGKVLDPGSDNTADVAELLPEILPYFSAKTPDGRPFERTMAWASIERVGDGDILDVVILLQAPQGASARSFELGDEIVLHRVVSHNVYVFLRTDVKTATLGEAPPELLGVMHYQSRTLHIDRSAGSYWTGLRAVFLLGAHHIAEGTDHLLFLFMLLLPAPLLAQRGRWSRQASVQHSIAQTAKVVTSFTIGHSLTLVLGAAGMAQLPPRGVEVFIAVSILISAAHAGRPLFPAREPMVAGLFGLVHGLAFASALGGFGLDGATLTLSVLGFNLGVEAMQLAIVLATMPWLVALSRAASYRILRWAGAAGGLLAAIGFIAERGFGLRNPIVHGVEALSAQAGWILAALALLAAFQWSRRRHFVQEARHFGHRVASNAR